MAMAPPWQCLASSKGLQRHGLEGFLNPDLGNNLSVTPGLLWVELEQPDSDEEEKEANELTKDGGENARTCPKPEVWLLAKVELALVCEVGGGELPRV